MYFYLSLPVFSHWQGQLDQRVMILGRAKGGKGLGLHIEGLHRRNCRLNCRLRPRRLGIHHHLRPPDIQESKVGLENKGVVIVSIADLSEPCYNQQDIPN